MIDFKQGAIILVIVGVICFLAGKYSGINNIKTDNQTKKEVETIKNTKKTIVKTKDKDGNEKTVTTIDSSTDTKSKEKTETKVTTVLPQYKVGLMYGYDGYQEKEVKGVLFGYRILSTIDLGVYLMDNKNYGVILIGGF